MLEPAPQLMMRRSRLRRVLLWMAIVCVALVVGLAVASYVILHPSNLRAHAERELEARLNLDVSIDAVELAVLPRPRVSGRGVTLRIRSHGDLPPFIQIDHFAADVGLFSAFRKQVDTVRIDGLRIAVPPGDARDELPRPANGLGSAPTDIIVRHLITQESEVRFIPSKPGARPLTFTIHELLIDDLGFDRAWPFRARLTNPKPTGLVETTGRIGPWNAEDATATPLQGEYALIDADLSTINGIGGTLQSQGSYQGLLTAIDVIGKTTMPDFSLDLGGRPVPLETTFHARVDGTDGSTRLLQVDAKLRSTSIVARGFIDNRDGPGRRAVTIESEIKDGRIEDILALAVEAPEPMLEGDINARSALVLPPGSNPVRRRIDIEGQFRLARARFTDEKVEDKLAELSRRSQGKRPEQKPERVMTSLRGHFTVRSGVVALRNLSFRVPGAAVALDGRYTLGTEALDFRGTLRMDAPVSRAVGGVRAIFLRPFDFLFRKDGAGAVIPIRITGTRQQPKMGMEVGRVFGRGK
jgi:hypothetical protein